MSIADRTWDHLPPEIHSRIMAATAHARIRRIERHDASDPALPYGHWTVDALAGDRFVHQVLALRADGSVSEDTRTALTEAVAVSFGADGATVTLPGPSGLESIPVPEPIGRAIDGRPGEELSNRSSAQAGHEVARGGCSS